MPCRRVLVTGASGRLGAGMLEQANLAGLSAHGWQGPAGRADPALRPVDLTDLNAIDQALALDDPGIVIHAAAVSTAEAVLRDPVHARRVNVEATARIAAWCVRERRRLVFTSTDLVFDGSRAFSREEDEPCPLLEYGRTKRAAELELAGNPGCVVVRIALLYGPAPNGRPGFFDTSIAALRRGAAKSFFVDEYRTPLDYRSAARGVLAIACSDHDGVFHLGGPERLSRFELMRRAAAVLGIDARLVLGNALSSMTFPEPRPADVSLDCTRLATLFPEVVRPTVEDALRDG